jgi:hypothetical protein
MFVASSSTTLFVLAAVVVGVAPPTLERRAVPVAPVIAEPSVALRRVNGTRRRAAVASLSLMARALMSSSSQDARSCAPVKPPPPAPVSKIDGSKIEASKIAAMRYAART